MKICVLDGEVLTDQKALHDRLAEDLGFPDWYGRNLDALYDCLTDLAEETEIRFRNEQALAEHLGNYAGAIKKVICTAVEENQNIQCILNYA